MARAKALGIQKSDSWWMSRIPQHLATLLRSQNPPETLFSLLQTGTGMALLFFPKGTQVGLTWLQT